MGATWPNLGPRCAPDSLTLLNIGPTKAQRKRESETEREREDPAQTRTQIGRRPAVRRKPHKSGRRPRARVLAGGLRLVTEGYIRSRPLPPTLLLDRAVYLRPTPCRPRVDPVSTDLYVSCAGCSKNVQKHRFLQCFVAFGGHDSGPNRAPVVSVMRAARTGLIDISWVLGT